VRLVNVAAVLQLGGDAFFFGDHAIYSRSVSTSSGRQRHAEHFGRKLGEGFVCSMLIRLSLRNGGGVPRLERAKPGQGERGRSGDETRAGARLLGDDLEHPAHRERRRMGGRSRPDTPFARTETRHHAEEIANG